MRLRPERSVVLPIAGNYSVAEVRAFGHCLSQRLEPFKKYFVSLVRLRERRIENRRHLFVIELEISVVKLHAKLLGIVVQRAPRIRHEAKEVGRLQKISRDKIAHPLN